MTTMDDAGADLSVLEGVPPEEMERFALWRARVRGTNISEKTLLATDYLNHFNEIVMLIEMIPDMPDMLEECNFWQPKSYQDHFRDSGFSDKELAIEAYEHVPTKFRKPFEASISLMTHVVRTTLQRLGDDLQGGDNDKLRIDCGNSVELIHRIIQTMNGIIHGTAHVMEQSEIDNYLGTPSEVA
jgi:hypothetical protein